MTTAERAEKLGPWYHEIKLGDYTTTSFMDGDTKQMWANIRAMRDRVDFQGKTVLEIGAMDGMWAFEAEEKWAKLVVATDIWQNKRLPFAIETRQSSVVPVTNADVQDLYQALKGTMMSLDLVTFDIVQCFSLLYHVQNPLLSLHQVRRVMGEQSLLMLETACWTGCPDEPATRLNRIPWVYEGDENTYWMPNFKCLCDLLSIAGFNPVDKTVARFPQAEKPAERVMMICRIGPPQSRITNFGSY
jgi:tRNA (mo5U34)-methyltransferase